MSIYSINQEYNDWRWGIMPMGLMVASNIVEVRARGSYSFVVKNAQQLQTQVPDPDDLKSSLGSLISRSVTDVIGELSLAVSNIAQLTTATEQVAQALQEQLEPKFSELGLQLTAIRVEAIESI